MLSRLSQRYGELLNAFKVNDGATLQDVVDQRLGFGDAIELAKWLFSFWLEHYTLDQVKACHKGAKINEGGIALNLEPINREKRKFEADVVALRGYQLFYFSCYSGNERSRAKSKLFEAMIRATQLGGDEALVALVCGGEKNADQTRDCVDSVRREVEANWQRTGCVQVFGRADWEKLAAKLQTWFNHGGYTVRR